MPCLTQVMPTVGFLVYSLIFIEYKLKGKLCTNI